MIPGKVRSKPGLFVFSMGVGVLLAGSLYGLAYVLIFHTNGWGEGPAYFICLVLAFPLFIFFHDHSAPVAVLVAVGLYDVLLFALPLFGFMVQRRNKTASGSPGVKPEVRSAIAGEH